MEDSGTISVLLIEDNIGDAELIEEMLHESKYRKFKLKHFETLSEGLEYLNNYEFDVILLDIGLPDSQGIDTLLKIRIQNDEIPIIIFTGLDDEKIGLDALKEGAQDYLIKGEVSTNFLIKTILYAIERNKTQRRLTELIVELKHSNEELQQFAYITSHDIQEPLRTIASFTQLLERRYKGQLDDNADQYIDFIVNAAVRMKEMIEDLLQYSRIGTNDVNLGLTDLEEVLQNVLSYLQTTIEDNKAVITHDPLPTLCIDKNQFIRLFQNLIGNAIKFKKPDEAPIIHISAKIDEKNNEYVFSIADNGIGIKEEYKKRIFEVFKRLHTIDTYDGTGIGLSIVKRIVERHGGHLWVESELDVGSTFYFTIPRDNEQIMKNDNFPTF
ncbi:sensor histidine kinase [Methanobacterium sp. ACI-7]|uniref:sensor histidine kinase n=1 Tax=unclassified Methanobacterium TaxID=2627676 RepID=UPI0039C2F323